MRTLNSFSLSLLVIFHLQTQSPPILPPLKEIYNGDIAGAKNTNEEHIESQFIQNVERFKQEEFGRKNKSTISDLFVSFFTKYASVESSWSEGLMVCTFSGKWGNASSIECQIKKQYAMIIEDPFDHTENCARSVNKSTLGKISDEFETTAKFLQPFPQLCEMHLLRQSLFGSSHERPKRNIGPFQKKIARTSRKCEESNGNKGSTIQVSQKACNPTIHYQFRPPGFSQPYSLDERSMPHWPEAVSTVPHIHRHQAQPSFQYNGRQHHHQQQYPLERKHLLQVSQHTCNPTIHYEQHPWTTHPHFLPPAMSQHCSLEERSMPGATQPCFLPPAFTQHCSLNERSMPHRPKVVSTVPPIHRHQAQPSFHCNGRQHHQQQQYPL